MPARRVRRVPEYREVVYSEEHWALLGRLREEAMRIMEVLASAGFWPVVHGSVVRGDVHEDSDVDVVLLTPVQPYVVEELASRRGLSIVSRRLVMATPASTPKVYFYLDHEGRRTISVFLGKPSKAEHDFYFFSGIADLEELRRGARKPGVNKELVLIVPTARGHVEMPLKGNEHYAARLLGADIQAIIEREEVLSRRDEVGRTGVFLDVEITPEETVEEALDRIARSNPFLRRYYRG
ncbi:MAG: nucleotidyltransferase domain-containing protein [Desulfurococcaceae archaeon]